MRQPGKAMLIKKDNYNQDQAPSIRHLLAAIALAEAANNSVFIFIMEKQVNGISE